MESATIKESLINDYIEDYNDLEVSEDKLHLKEVSTLEDGSMVTLLTDSILLKYKNDLDELVETKTLTIQEQNRYFFNPWVLSYDLYGTTEFWFLLLDLNEMSSATEFTQETIKVYDGSLMNIVNAILALEEEFINQNEEELESALSNL